VSADRKNFTPAWPRKLPFGNRCRGELKHRSDILRNTLRVVGDDLASRLGLT